MRCWGAVGYMSQEAYRHMGALMKAGRKAADDRLRDEIRALSDQDIQKIMSRVIRERMAASGSVVEADFINRGIPLHRAKKNWNAALRLARRVEPKLDAMRDAPCAI